MSFSFIPLKAFRFTEIARYGQPMKSNIFFFEAGEWKR